MTDIVFASVLNITSLLALRVSLLGRSLFRVTGLGVNRYRTAFIHLLLNTFLTSGHSKRFTILPNIHPFMHTFSLKATASSSGVVVGG